MTAARLRELPQISIFELVALTYKFIRFELVHAGVAVGVFGAIFLILRPWNSDHYGVDDHPFWFVGPPLIYFTLDLCLAMFLHFALKNELKPKSCLIWVFLQVANLILLTVLGFYMVFTYYYHGNTYLRLMLALIVLYLYKAYRISQMHHLVILMRNRCVLTSAFGNSIPIQNVVANEKQPYVISANQQQQGQFPVTFSMQVQKV